LWRRAVQRRHELSEKRKTEAEREANESFRERERELVRHGALEALETLRAVMKGEVPDYDDQEPEEQRIPRDPDTQTPKAPDWQTRAIAARDYLRAIGYEESKKQQAEALAEKLRVLEEAEGDDEPQEVDVGIDGVDFEKRARRFEQRDALEADDGEGQE